MRQGISIYVASRFFGIVNARTMRRSRAAPAETARILASVCGLTLDTTNGNLAAGDLVLLADDQHLQPAENVVPVVTGRALARYGQRLADAVNAVSAQLTSQALLFMGWRIEVAGAGVMAEARGWLERHGILPRPG